MSSPYMTRLGKPKRYYCGENPNKALKAWNHPTCHGKGRLRNAGPSPWTTADPVAWIDVTRSAKRSAEARAGTSRETSMMRTFFQALALCLLLAPMSAIADHAPRTPLGEKQIVACERMEQEHPACNVCGGTYSESQARAALWIQLGAAAAGLGLIVAAALVFRATCCRLKFYGRIMRRGRERRNAQRSPMPPGRCEVTLDGPFGTITAAVVDIGPQGLQIEVTQAPPNGLKGLGDALRARTALSLSLTGADGSPDLKHATCRVVWVCGVRAGLAFRDTTDIGPILAAGAARGGEPQ